MKTPFCLRNCVFSPAHQLALLRRETEIVLDTHTADDFVTWHGERHR
ncbi:MAG: hypothetical protein LR015_14825 [Verrucomicrobia bacterium]|nr:hypothetical protein [Verrucomicrobiota bacterium]